MTSFFFCLRFFPLSHCPSHPCLVQVFVIPPRRLSLAASRVESPVNRDLILAVSVFGRQSDSDPEHEFVDCTKLQLVVSFDNAGIFTLAQNQSILVGF